MALSKFGGKTEKCGRRYFYFADFANLSGDAGSDELQRDLGRQRGQIGSVQAGMVRMCEEGRRRLGRHDHDEAYTVRKVGLGWDYQVLETPRDSEIHQTEQPKWSQQSGPAGAQPVSRAEGIERNM